MCKGDMFMAANKTFTKREVQKILKNNGFTYVSENGNRCKYKRGNEILMINPEPNKMIFNRLIKEYNLAV
jgi:predicted RNA binding protein YcfA (HicA-like mRNA interferase family)